jgi:putative selenium metabolism protein SsnA
MLIKNATLVPWDEPGAILPGSALYLRDGLIADMGAADDLAARYPQAEQLDAGGQYVLPGNICAHTHFYGAYARGMAIPGAAPADFPQILDKLWWPLDKALDDDSVYYSALVCLVDAVKHGTTTLIDHHASPNAAAGSLDGIARAVDESGLRAALCYEVTDRDGPEKARLGIEENIRFLRRAHQDSALAGRVGAMFGLHASLTLSDETLRAARAAVEALGFPAGFHVHVAEHAVDQQDALAKYGLRVVERLQRGGILGPRTIAVHAVHVDDREIDLLAETQTWVSHQPRSNMNNGVGLPRVEAMLRAGVRVCLGNDGFSNAMWEEWKTAYLAHKLLHQDPRRLPADQIARMAVEHNRVLAEQAIGSPPLGILRPGAAADLIFVDYHPFTPVTAGNLPWHIVFGFHESMVTATIAGGRVLMRDRELLFLDEEKIAAEARRLAPATWERYASRVQA